MILLSITVIDVIAFNLIFCVCYRLVKAAGHVSAWEKQKFPVTSDQTSIHLLLLILLGLPGELEPISASLGEGRVTLSKSPVHYRASIQQPSTLTLTPMGNLE